MSTKKQSHGNCHSAEKQPGARWWILATVAILFAAIVFSCGRLIDQGTRTVNENKVEMPDQQGDFQWSKAPEMSIDPRKSYRATMRTEIGDIVIRLFAEESPVTVNNFVFLARQGFYDGVTFHRVIPGFMAQSGDRTGTGSGGPGYTFEDEFSNGLEFEREGLLAMANRGSNTNGSQFFITYESTPHLNGAHTIFGEVVEGMEIVLALRPRDPQSDPDPGSLIETILIEEG